MSGSRIFDWGDPRTVKVREYAKNVALFTLKSWPIGGAMTLCPPPPRNRPWPNFISSFVLSQIDLLIILQKE